MRTFVGEVLEKEFQTTIEGYPTAARRKTNELRVSLRSKGKDSALARALLSAFIDLMDLSPLWLWPRLCMAQSRRANPFPLCEAGWVSRTPRLLVRQTQPLSQPAEAR